jgi:ABC-type nitrate/sulfonate/bicarbonate transport system permease component
MSAPGDLMVEGLPVRAKPHMGNRILARAGALLVDSSAVIVTLILWQIATTVAGSVFFPTPLEIFAQMREIWLSGDARTLFLSPGVREDILPSLGRMLAGWGIAAIIGIALGVAIGRSRLFANLVDPSLQFLRAIPGPALIPIFLLLLGTETTMRIGLIVFSSLWPILLNTIEGVRTVETGHLQTAAVFKIPSWAQLFRIVLPSAGPKILAGLRVSLSIALILMVISEMIAATNGIGYRVAYSQQNFQFPEMWAGIVLLALLGFGLNWIFTRVENRLLAWHRGARQRARAEG